MTWLLSIIVAFATPVLAATGLGYGTRLAIWISRQATRLLPPDQRNRYCEEWERDILDKSKGPLEDRDGNHHLAALLWGIWSIRGALAQSRAAHRISSWLRSERSNDSLLRTAAAVLYGSASTATYWLLTGIADQEVLIGVLVAVSFSGFIFYGAFPHLKRAVESGMYRLYLGALATTLVLASIVLNTTLGPFNQDHNYLIPVVVNGGLFAATATFVHYFGPALLGRLRSRLLIERLQ